MKRWVVLTSSLGCASLLGLLLWNSLSGRPPTTAPAPQAAGSPPPTVTGVRVAPEAFAESITANGTLRAEESVELQAEVNGKIIALNFREGTVVRAGDVLVKIDDSSLQASLRRADARRELAEHRERRIAKLLSEGGFSQQAYDEARAELAVQQAEADVIRAEIKRTEIRAPFDGVVGLRFVSLGAYVNPNTRIATLQRVDNLKLDLSVPERYASRIRVGTPLTFTVAGSTESYHGEIYAAEPRIDVSTRTILLRALCSNPSLALLPGTFARVELTVTETEPSLLVPAISVLAGLDERFVFVSRDGRAERLRVRTGARTASRVQIVEGLQVGDVVLTSGVQQLRSGLPVQVQVIP